MKIEQEAAPIIIIGAPRSGTTYLNRILNEHPDVSISNESRIFVWAHQSLRVLTRQEQVLLEDADVFQDHLRRSFPDLIRGYYRSIAPSARYWGDKYPSYASLKNRDCLQMAIELFPGTRFIHIVRDGRDVVSSLLRRQWGTYESAPRIWINHVESASALKERVAADQYFELRYEDLIRDDLGVAGQVFQFLCIPMDERVVNFCQAQQEQRTPMSRPTRDLAAGAGHSDWHRLFDPGKQRQTLELLGPLLVRYGYESPESLAEEKARLEAHRAQSDTWDVIPWEPHHAQLDRLRTVRIRELADAVVPQTATVTIISRGDNHLLELGGRRAWHFPRMEDGQYAGYYPETSEEVVAQLEETYAAGSNFLVVPSTASWWLDHYAGFREHLQRNYRLVAERHDTCLIFARNDRSGSEGPVASTRTATD